MKILVLNAGSSTQKSRLYELGDSLPEQPPQPLWDATCDWTKTQGKAEIVITTADGRELKEELQTTSRSTVLEHMLQTMWSGTTQIIAGPAEINMVGHRVVHGGQEFRKSTLVTSTVKATIQRFAAFAPLHNPANLEGIEAIEQLLPYAPQVAVFDTAFHSQLSMVIACYPGPYEWYEQGIRRYGFHGISHQYCAQRATQLLGYGAKDAIHRSLRMITCHLGNGCSLAAIKDGHSVDTTMGFTPLEGLMMGSRSGTIDPGILLYLLRQQGYTVDTLDRVLNRESGLKGVSELSGDMRQLLEACEAGNERARLAFDMFIYRLRYFICAMLASLGGLDVLVFTAGIGENAPIVRSETCKGLGFLGVKLAEEKNIRSATDHDIATSDSAVRVLVIHTQEDWTIAQECWHIAIVDLPHPVGTDLSSPQANSSRSSEA